MYLIKRKNGIYAIQYLDPRTGKFKRKSTGIKSRRGALGVLKNFNPTYNESEKKNSLSSFQKEYIQHSSSYKSKKYIKSINLSFRQLINFCNDIPLQRLTIKILDQFISERFSTSPSAALLYFRTLKAAFSKAVMWEYIDENPFKKIKPPRQKKSFPVFISKSDLEKIIEHTPSILLKDIFYTAFFSGMRLSEILNLIWECIDLNRRLILIKNINGFVTKSKRERIIPMNEHSFKLFHRRYDNQKKYNDNSYIFYRVIDVKLNEDYVSKQFKKAVRSAKLNDQIHFHSLRHSFASNLIQKGASIYVVKELLGHESISTTQIYSHLQSDNLSQAVSLLDD